MTSPPALGSMTKVLFVVDDEGGQATELLWASYLGRNQFKVSNIPLYAFNVSFADVIDASANQPDDRPQFSRVVTKSGHRTLRIMFDIGAEAEIGGNRLLESLAKLGCGWEGAFNKTYFAVNVPPEVNIDDVVQLVEGSDVRWEMADPAD